MVDARETAEDVARDVAESIGGWDWRDNVGATRAERMRGTDGEVQLEEWWGRVQDAIQKAVLGTPFTPPPAPAKVEATTYTWVEDAPPVTVAPIAEWSREELLDFLRDAMIEDLMSMTIEELRKDMLNDAGETWAGMSDDELREAVEAYAE